MYTTAILRLSAGPINQVNDSLPGGGGGNIGPQVGYAGGQLGAGFSLSDAELLYNSTIGTVYGGAFQYVRLSAAAGAVAVGQIVFWDTVADAALGLYQVTTAENGTADAAVNAAGIVLNSGWTPGNYSVIQIVGPTYVKFRAALTDAGAIGSRVYCAAVGGADLGLADVLSGVGNTTQDDVSLMQARFLGVAIDAPTNGGTQRVYIDLHNQVG